MFFRLRRKLLQRKLNNMIEPILRTPPLKLVDRPWSIISMVNSAEVPMYLLAIKSFYTRLGGGKIVAIVDRDMPATARQVLEAHLPGIQFRILEDIAVGPCQQGGTWERLITLVRHSTSEYAIQIDSDILTVGNIDEIIACVEGNRAFTLNGHTGNPLWTIPEAIAAGNAFDNDHCTIAFERHLSQYPNPENKLYVRGSSGLAGFAKNGYKLADLEAFHQDMSAIMGSRWLEWGTEQVGSNWAVANSPNPLVLPYPKYANFIPETPRHQSSALHFIGTYRYDEGYYAKLAKTEIARLSSL
jgi:hypothetical protein